MSLGLISWLPWTSLKYFLKSFSPFMLYLMFWLLCSPHAYLLSKPGCVSSFTLPPCFDCVCVCVTPPSSMPGPLLCPSTKQESLPGPPCIVMCSYCSAPPPGQGSLEQELTGSLCHSWRWRKRKQWDAQTQEVLFPHTGFGWVPAALLGLSESSNVSSVSNCTCL